MPKMLRIALRDYVESVHTKAFIISIVLAPVFMCGGLLAIYLLKDQVDTKDKHVALIDHTGEISAFVEERAEQRNTIEIFDPETREKVRPGYVIEVVEPPGDDGDLQDLRVELSNRIENRELAAFVEIGADVVEPGGDTDQDRIFYHSEADLFDELRDWLDDPINDRIRNMRLTAAGLDENEVRRYFDWVNLQRMGLVKRDADTGEVHEEEAMHEGLAIGIPLAAMMLMFMMIMTGAVPLISATLEEKTQRISEVLLGSVRPFEMMMGKLIGNYFVSLTVVGVYLTGLIAVGYYQGFLDRVPLDFLPWFFVNTFMAIFMFGSLCTAVGAACNDAKEVQSLTMPLMIPIIIPMMIWVPVIKEPLSTFSTWVSLFPPFTPILMLLRQVSPGGIPAWQPWVGMIGMLALTLFNVWAGGRIFRIGLLMQGQPPKITDLVRWAIRG